MGHILKLLYGDKRAPIRTLDLAEAITTGQIFLQVGGFSPGVEQNVVWSGQSSRRDGQARVNTSYDNITLQITYDLQGGSAAELAYLQREIHRFFMECRQYEENKELERVWLEYRWSDGLADVPAPVFGQFSYYYRVLSGTVSRWPRDLHGGALTAGQVLGVVAELTCKPFAEGLRQKVGMGKGQLELRDEGLLIMGVVNTEFTNPGFGHATWNTGWTVEDADLKAEHETRPGFTRSLNSAAKLTNINQSTDYYYVQSIDVTNDSVTYVCACYARREDGGAISSSDLALILNGSTVAATFLDVGGGWYLCYASATSGVGAANYGIDVKSGRTIIVDDFYLAQNAWSTKPMPFSAGYSIGGSWSGTAHESYSGVTTTSWLYWTLGSELCGKFTVSFWVTPQWDNSWLTADVTIFNYYVDANNEIVIDFDYSSDHFKFKKEVDGSGGATWDTGATQSISYGDHIHVCLVQDDTNCTLYINGSQDAQLARSMADAPDGYMGFGAEYDGDKSAFVLIDGCRVWDVDFSATEVSNLYNNEKEVKDAGGSIGMPPYLWTKDGDNILDNVDGLVSAAAKDNWGIVGGVVGDMEAQTEWRIQPPTATPSVGYWLGRKAVDEPIGAGTFWVDYNGTADVGNSSDDAYKTLAAGTTDSNENGDFVDTNSFRFIPGHYQFLLRLKVSTNEIQVYSFYNWGVAGINHAPIGDTLTIGTNANFLLRDIGDMVVRAPSEIVLHNKELTEFRWGFAIDRTATATVDFDFLQMLPYPYCYVESIDDTLTISAGEELIIESETLSAYTINAGAANEIFEYQGEPVTVVPNAYNYVYILQGAKDAQYDVTDTATVNLYVTPRWLLPGGAIA